MDADNAEGRAKGGIARAALLTPQQRSEIATKAASVRWGGEAEVALKSGKLQIGDLVIPCAVLGDKTRVLSERAITKAFGGKRGGSHWQRIKKNPSGAELPIFLSATNIIPFIDNELHEGLRRRRSYRPTKGGGVAHGIEAILLPKICNALLRLRDANAYQQSQYPIVVQADIIMRGLAEVGIIALVDEATGFIDEKSREEYRELFREFIRNECRQYEKEFPDAFFDAVYRLYGLQQGSKGKHPQFFGKFIRKHIYEPLASSKGAILEMLDEKNPVVYESGGRRYKLFQFLSDTVGMLAFRAHLWQVVGIGNASRGKKEFDRNFKRAFPVARDQLELPFDE